LKDFQIFGLYNTFGYIYIEIINQYECILIE